MKQLFLPVIIAFFLLAGFSYAADITPNLETSNRQHLSHRHVHLFLKEQHMPPVDINHANENTLSTLKGVGPKKAQAIITYRNSNGPFKTIDDLAHVKGIGKKSVMRLEANNPGRILM